ncbi:MAG: hypothetical protein HY706_08565 [Candidatus Hydrogenedentes bacterium]|nr:hypothetical protein [Candidatus Hydrogenedentota bacterium]
MYTLLDPAVLLGIGFLGFVFGFLAGVTLVGWLALRASPENSAQSGERVLGLRDHGLDSGLSRFERRLETLERVFPERMDTATAHKLGR